MNEEDVKIKILLPWLKDLGVDTENLYFEKYFSVRVGRKSVNMRGDYDHASGRLDILVTKNSDNILVVEAKAKYLKLTESDRDQAISYARLVHPIAPYALVTNGQDYELYDTISKESIKPEEFDINGVPGTITDEARTEAQALFLNLSTDNLLAFCKSQVSSELRIVSGKATDGFKFDNDLHVAREELQNSISEFYKSEKQALLIVGSSGEGKTSELVWTSLRLLEQHQPTLFFNGTSLAGSITSAISNEFLWLFNRDESPIKIVNRLERLVPKNSCITIIIDAIDEWTHSDRAADLGLFLKSIHSKRIRVIMSCKLLAEASFLSRRGNPTEISASSKKIQIPQLSPKEFSKTIEKYRNVFRFYGGIESEAFESCRKNPFLLRVLFEVAHDQKLKHITYDSSHLFERYFQKSISRTENPNRASRILIEIALLLYISDADRIEEDRIREALNLDINVDLMPELFQYNLLQRGIDENNNVLIGFYFSQLRDYIVCFKSRKFQSLAPNDLLEEFNASKFSKMKSEVFTSYYRLIDVQRKQIFDKGARTNATKYLRSYKSILENNFPNLISSFAPYTKGNIGFAADYVLASNEVRLYGFREIGAEDDEVFFFPEPDTQGTLYYLHGVEGMHGRPSFSGFQNGRNIQPEVIELDILKPLEKILSTGALNEAHLSDLLSEQVYSIWYDNKDTWPKREHHQTLKDLVPLEQIKEDLLYAKLYKHHYNELIEQKRKIGKIKEQWSNQGASYSYSHSEKDREIVRSNTLATIASQNIPERLGLDVDFNKIDATLSEAINKLEDLGEYEVSPPVTKLAAVDLSKPLSEIGDELTNQLDILFNGFLKNYKEVLDYNFPTIKYHFNLYSNIPLSIYYQIEECPSYGALPDKSPSILIHFVKHNSSCPVVMRVTDSNIQNEPFALIVCGETQELIYALRASVQSILNTTRRLDSNSFRNMPIRSLVYSTIADEFDYLLRDHDTAIEIRTILRESCANVQ